MRCFSILALLFFALPLATHAEGALVQLKNSEQPTVIETAPHESLPALILRLRSDPSVEFAEPNYARTLNSLPTDPYAALQWHLSTLDLPAALDLATGTEDTLVGIIDTGVLYTHEDLAASMWDAAACVDEMGAPLGGCIHGYDFLDNDLDPAPATTSSISFHGTHVAGIAGAKMNNDIGISGVAAKAHIAALRFNLDVASEVRAIDFAIHNGIKILNASYTGQDFSQAEFDAIERFTAAGGLFIAAAGNDSSNTDSAPRYPADINLPGVISVAATAEDDSLATFSNYGPSSVDLGAPGVDILSTYTSFEHPYAFAAGTSMAAPMVAGAAAYLLSIDPTLSATELKYILLNSGDALPALAGKSVSGRRLNLYKAALMQKAMRAPIVASVFGAPTATDTSSIPRLFVSIGDVEAYKYSLDATPWSDELTTTTPIVAENLQNGTHALRVIGKNSFGAWQSVASSTEISWVVEDMTPPSILNLSSLGTTTAALWSWSTDDPLAEFRFATTTASTSESLLLSAWSSATSTGTTTGEGLLYVYVESRDTNGNVGAASTTALLILETPPPPPEPKVEPAPAPVHSGGGGGGGGGGSLIPPLPLPTATSTATTTLLFATSTPTTTLLNIQNPPRFVAGEVLGAGTYTFTKYLILGSKNTDVLELQRLLVKLGHFSVAPTGYFGAITKKAVQAYQKANGIAQTGTVGPLTRKSLNLSFLRP